MAIMPTEEQFTEFARGRQEGEVIMINLLHFARGLRLMTPIPELRQRGRVPIATTALR